MTVATGSIVEAITIAEEDGTAEEVGTAVAGMVAAVIAGVGER
jgi:hypothetical protein